MNSRLAIGSVLALVLATALCTLLWPTSEDDRASTAPIASREAGTADANGATSSEPPNEELHPLDVIAQPWTGGLEGMIERRVIRVLTVYSAGHFYLDHGREKGINKEFAQRFEAYINKQLVRDKPRVYVALIPVARNELIPGLLQGRGDLVMAGLTITPERKKEVDFSIPVSNSINEILVTGPSAPLISATQDLSGETVYLRRSSSYRESLEQLNAELAEEGEEPVELEYVDESLEDDDLVEMVDAGLLPWAVVDDYKVGMWRDVFTDLTPRDDIVLRKGGRIGWAFRKHSPKLAEAVNAFLKENRQGTRIGNILIKRYITNFDWADNALESEDFARFQALLDTFERYGRQYNINHLLLAAQGYQESRLDQRARSHAGAVGIMQLKPATAADPNVGIPDISTAENNIHAGAKYLAFLRSRYFSDPEMDSMNRVLMSLAAYNTGPARMINLRNKARGMGYDPNVWFDNVELVAAAEVGQEPVRYVARIFKYYLAYRYALETLARREEARKEAGII